MSNGATVVHAVQAALEHDVRINLHRHPIRIDFVSGAVVLEGDVPSVGAKKVALRLAGAVPGVRGVIDRLHVAPSERKGDGAMRDSLAAFLLHQPELRDCRIRTRGKCSIEVLRDAPQPSGDIEFTIDDGIVTYEGVVQSLSHKRVMGVLAWWTPGCRDVVNALDVVPGEEDNDGEVGEALRLVLEMDPLVDASQITASCRDGTVTLRGYVRTAEERRQAEVDAWALFAVDHVTNEIEVRG
jgi:osmotically-inducible protein OsmY